MTKMQHQTMTNPSMNKRQSMMMRLILMLTTPKTPMTMATLRMTKRTLTKRAMTKTLMTTMKKLTMTMTPKRTMSLRCCQIMQFLKSWLTASPNRYPQRI